MQKQELNIFIDKLISALTELNPQYGSNPQDAFGDGNVAVCVIDDEGNIYGKIWGDNKIKGRQFYKHAWTKASQVWITGMKTSEYEKKVFNNEVDEDKFGISRPDLIGWEGGQPVVLKNGTKLSVGFSGYRGFNDLEIVLRAIEMVGN